MFPHSRDVRITGGNFTTTGGTTYSAFEKLQNACAPSAFHNSNARFDPPKCHPNTRVAILKYLMKWISGRTDAEARILWLYGPAGAGKSAILQTIAEYCFERKIILASFFFSRSDPTRNTFKPLVATIAYQIATIYPEMKPHLESVIERDPLIFDKSVAAQLQSLVVDPLKALNAAGVFTKLNPWVRLVLIDGLDECNDPRMQSAILRALADMLRNEKLNIVFLIASRPEQHLTLTFNSPPLAGLWRSRALDDSCEPDEDIRLFLEDSFREIRTTHPHCRLIPNAWPEPSDVETLIRKSSGQFIYAAVVIKYVSAPIDRPPRRLDEIMGLRAKRRESRDVPFSELDALYMHILSSCADPDAVLRVLGLVIVGQFVTVDYVEILLDLEPGDVEMILAPLASIVYLEWRGLGPSPYKRYLTVGLYHASFGDFLVDASRSSPFHIDTVNVKMNIIERCLAKLMDPSSSIGHNLLEYDPYLLQEPFEMLQHIRLTEVVESVLNTFSLPQFWSSRAPPLSHYGERGDRISIVSSFLTALAGPDMHCNRPYVSDFSTIYTSHLSSFELVIHSEIPKYYQDVGLTSLVVISMLDVGEGKYEDISAHRERALMALLRLTAESMRFDHDTLGLAMPAGRDLLRYHYPHLLIGPKKSPELCLNGDQHAQTALRILEFLCDHPLENHNKRHSFHGRAPGRPSRYLMPRTIAMLTSINFPRKRREEKHRYGVTFKLSIPNLKNDRVLFPQLYPAERRNHMQKICVLGLSYLPDILERCSRSTELMNFIQGHEKDIVSVPKLTQRAICAMHEYLDRAKEDFEVVFESIYI